MWVFHINVSWWSFTGVWMTASFLVSRTLLSILADLNSVVVYMFSIYLPISNSSYSFTKPLKTVPSPPIKFCITGIFIVLSLYSSLARSKYLSFFCFCFLWFSLRSVRTAKSTRQQVLLWIELPWPENPANTYARHTETLDSCFDLIRSHQECIPWSPPLEVKPATTDCRAEKLYNWPSGHIAQIPFGKFQFLAQFPVDLFSYPVVLILRFR